jgi:hypothetical protein
LPPMNPANTNAGNKTPKPRDSKTPLKQKSRVLSVRVAAGVLRLAAGFVC